MNRRRQVGEKTPCALKGFFFRVGRVIDATGKYVIHACRKSCATDVKRNMTIVP